MWSRLVSLCYDNNSDYIPYVVIFHLCDLVILPLNCLYLCHCFFFISVFDEDDLGSPWASDKPLALVVIERERWFQY